MLHKKIFLVTLLSLNPVFAYALTCPTNFSIINIGDSLESVKQACGKPDAEKTKEEPKPTPQEWTYYTSQTISPGTSYQTSGTLKTTITFDKDDKAINISVNGIGVGQSTICGTPIQLSSTRQEVKAACGDPSFINKQGGDSAGGQSDNITITECTYNSNPPVTLIFTSGKLSGTK